MMTTKRVLRHRAMACLLVTGLSTLPLSVFGEGNTANITVKVTVVSQPCKINDNQIIEVDFKEVVTTLVDGKTYRKTLVPYTLTCPAGTADATAMKLQILGDDADFYPGVLKTSVGGLGIRLMNGSSGMAVNSSVNFTWPNKPELYAIPVKKPNTALPGGAFTASAVMKVDYQ